MQSNRMFLCLFLAVLCAASASAQESTGVLVNKSGASDGYTLYSPIDGAGSYLIDNEGRVVHYWDNPYRSSISYLQDDGSLFRTIGFGNGGNGHFHGGGAGYGIQQLSWEGEVLWEFVYSNEEHLVHHDIAPLPNGNVLAIAWERKSREEAIAAGRNPETVGDDGLWPLHVIEVAPKRPTGGEIVWEWHVWDHVIQDTDADQANYGDPSAQPGRVDINPPGLWLEMISDEEREQLEALGYLGGAPAGRENRGRGGRGTDWLHTNAIAYNAELDQIALSALGNNEIWIIDHSTTTEEARGSSGGRYGKGGDLLYRWGNPMAYRAGGYDHQALFAQHDVQWIPSGYPGGGDLLIFNNGRNRGYSSIVQLSPPQSAPGHYEIEIGKPFGPAEPTWEYTAPVKEDFFSVFISGTQRQPNGNTLICAGAQGTIFEVTPAGETVWRYVSPIKGPPGSSHRGKDGEPSNVVFRANRYAKDHPAFAGRNLSPGLEVTKFLEENPPVQPLER